MADLYEYINSSGVIIPDTEAIQEEVEQEYKSTFGDDLDVTPETPQGRLIELDTRLRSEVLRCAAETANVINPNLAYGIFLDAICALTGCYRKNATRSSVTATLGGVAGTVIPANSLAMTEDYSKVFYLVNDAIIGVDGTVDAVFNAQDYGAVSLAAGELNRIKTGVLGWETITNAEASSIGRNEESDADLKSRRVGTLFNGRSLMGDIKSRLANIEGVKSDYVDQNYKANPLTLRGVTILPHSIYVCVDGGSDDDIGMALYMTNPCADFTGNTTVTVTDPWTQQQYEVKFQRPTEVEIDVKIYVKVATGTGDVTGAIKQSIQDYQDGLIENVDGLKIGVSVSPFEIASAVNIEVPGIFVQQVQIARHNKTLASNVLEMKIDEIARISPENVTIRYVA